VDTVRQSIVYHCCTELKFVGESEAGEVTWSLVASRANDSVQEEDDGGSTTACINHQDAQHSAAAASASVDETEVSEASAAIDGVDVIR